MILLSEIILEFIFVLKYSAYILINKINLPQRKIVLLLFTYLKILFKYLLLVKLLNRNPTSEKIFNRKLNFFSYAAFFSMFKDIFLENHYFFGSLDRKPVIFDLGTNIGLEIIYYKWLYPAAKIFAFEPDRETYRVLTDNLKQNNLQDVYLKNVALTGKKGKVKFYRDPHDPGSLIMSTGNRRNRKSFTYVRSDTLSSFIGSEVDFLKMDIEGSEYQVVKDLQKRRVFKYIKKMVIEYHHHLKTAEDNFSRFLAILEKNNFGYQITTKLNPPFRKIFYQDLLVSAYQKKINV